MNKLATINSSAFLVLLFCCLASLARTDAKCMDSSPIQIGPEIASIQSDNFPAGKYDDYTHCRWFITGPPNTLMRISFTVKFDVETSSPQVCGEDALTIFDTTRPGSSDAISKLGLCEVLPTTFVLCGSSLPEPITLEGNTAVVQFCSDYAVTADGWQISLDYIPAMTPPVWVPAEHVITLTTVGPVVPPITILSPNYPNKYYNGYTATYTIRNTRRANPVYIKNNVVELGSETQDTITVVDVTNNKTYKISGKEVNGPGLPPGGTHMENFEGLEFINTEEIQITFVSDPADAFKGFELVVTLELCPRSQFACDNGVGCYAPSDSCNGVKQCDDGSDEKRQYCSPDCGKPHISPKTTNRIVGGQFVTRHSIPWQAAMLSRGVQSCGGTIITDRWVLTAAHCFDDACTRPGCPVTGRSVRLGGHDLTASTEADGAVEIEVEKILCHPEYVDKDFDQCLVKLKQTIPFRRNIVPACLPPPGTDVPVGKECLISGWGNPRTELQWTEILKQAYVPVVSRAACKAAYDGKFPNAITKNMICAGFAIGGTDTCQGDSGGPFVCKNSDNSWTVDGIVSWGEGCALPEYPGVYASTASVGDWIVETIATN